MKNILMVFGFVCLANVSMGYKPIGNATLLPGFKIGAIDNYVNFISGTNANKQDLIDLYRGLLRCGIPLASQMDKASSLGANAMLVTTGKVVEVLEMLNARQDLVAERNALLASVRPNGHKVPDATVGTIHKKVVSTINQWIDETRHRKSEKLEGMVVVANLSSIALLELSKFMGMFIGLSPDQIENGEELGKNLIGGTSLLSPQEIGELKNNPNGPLNFNFNTFDAALTFFDQAMQQIKQNTKGLKGETFESARMLKDNISMLKKLLRKIGMSVIFKLAKENEINLEGVMAYLTACSVRVGERQYNTDDATNQGMYPHTNALESCFDPIHLRHRIASDLKSAGVGDAKKINEYIDKFNERLEKLYNDSHAAGATIQWPRCLVPAHLNNGNLDRTVGAAFANYRVPQFNESDYDISDDN